MIMESYLEGSMLQAVQRRAEKGLQEGVHDLDPEESAVLALLQQRLHPPPHQPGKKALRQQAAGP